MTNERILESRNKREGGYIGRTRYDRKSGQIGKPKHARKGKTPDVTLRMWGRYWARDEF